MMDLKQMLELLPPMGDASRHVYVAGPYDQGDVAINVKRAMDAGTRVMDAGFIPFIPHLTHFFHMSRRRSRTEWLTFSASWLLRCGAVYNYDPHLPSEGRDLELELARWYGIPIVESTLDLCKD